MLSESKSPWAFYMFFGHVYNLDQFGLSELISHLHVLQCFQVPFQSWDRNTKAACEESVCTKHQHQGKSTSRISLVLNEFLATFEPAWMIDLTDRRTDRRHRERERKGQAFDIVPFDPSHHILYITNPVFTKHTFQGCLAGLRCSHATGAGRVTSGRYGVHCYDVAGSTSLPAAVKVPWPIFSPTDWPLAFLFDEPAGSAWLEHDIFIRWCQSALHCAHMLL